mmetsp:Transcript_15844/g.26488  ORF Transcript_15844/g.26488 Transcript_15844/m.26488 type:complete len:195 (+) Transcript_15844:197-781(+)
MELFDYPSLGEAADAECGQPASLTEICTDCIIKSNKYKTVEAVLSIYCKLDSGNPVFTKARAFSKGILRERYSMWLEKFGYDELSTVINPEDLEMFDIAHREYLAVKKRFSELKGTVLAPIEYSSDIIKRRDDGTYPIEVLLQGAAWPTDVDPAKREQYLSNDDFKHIFGITKEEFNNKDKFVRVRLKKEHKLF